MSIPIVYYVSAQMRRRWLRRYQGDLKCPGPMSYHDATTFISDIPLVRGEDGVIEHTPPELFKDDPRWPKQCGCGYVFQESDPRQVFHRELWHPIGGGELLTIEELPVGAMWDNYCLHDFPQFCGPDGKSLHVKLPGGHQWCIDSRASNCDQPDRPHKCWVRSGTPPNLTVGKGAPGESCNAGAGSILVPNWHGFLRNGHLEVC